MLVRCLAISYVGEPIALTMGLKGTAGLWIYGRQYILGGRASDFFLFSRIVIIHGVLLDQPVGLSECT
jgi:hypothetical protein